MSACESLLHCHQMIAKYSLSRFNNGTILSNGRVLHIAYCILLVTIIKLSDS